MDAEITNVKIERKDGNVILTQEIKETLTELEFNKFVEKTKVNIIALENERKRKVAEAALVPIYENEEDKKLAEEQAKSIEKGRMIYNAKLAKKRIEEIDETLALYNSRTKKIEEAEADVVTTNK